MRYCLSHMTAFNLMMSSSRIMGRSDAVGHSKGCSRIPDVVLGNDCYQEMMARYGELPQHSYITPRQNTNQPIDLLISSNSGKRRRSQFKVHVDTRQFTSRLVAPIDSDREGSIVCPELVFLELASKLDLIGTIAVGYALCSAYYLDSSARGGVSLRKDAEQLTSISKLKSFIDKNAGKNGSRRARVALRYIHNAARSPREIALAMLLCLPRKYGGFNLGDVHLNVPMKIPVSGKNRFVTRIPDLQITAEGRDGKSHSLALDYDPISTHGGREIKDLSRKNQIIAADKFPHLSVTKENVNSFSSACEIAWQIQRVLKKRSPKSLATDTSSKLTEFSQREFNAAIYGEASSKETAVYHRQWELWNRLFRSI